MGLASCPLSPGSLQLLPLPLSHMAMQPNVKFSIPLTLLFLSAGDVFFLPAPLVDNLSNFKARCEFHLFCAALQSSAEASSGLTSGKWNQSFTTNPWDLCLTPCGSSIQRYIRALGTEQEVCQDIPSDSRGTSDPRKGYDLGGVLQLEALGREGCLHISPADLGH